MLWLYCLRERQIISYVHIQFNVCIHVHVPPLMVSQSRGEGDILTSYIMQSREKKGISNDHVCHMVLEVKPGIWQAHKDLFWLTINILFLLPAEKAWDSSTRWESSTELQEDLPGSVGKQWWCHQPPICRYCCSEGKELVSCHWKGLIYNYRGTSRQHYQKWSLVFW